MSVTEGVAERDADMNHYQNLITRTAPQNWHFHKIPWKSVHNFLWKTAIFALSHNSEKSQNFPDWHMESDHHQNLIDWTLGPRTLAQIFTKICPQLFL